MAPSMLEAGTAADAILLGGPPRAWTGGTPFTQMWPVMLRASKDYMLKFIEENPGVNHCMLMFEMHRVKRTDPVSSLACTWVYGRIESLFIPNVMNRRALLTTSKHQDIRTWQQWQGKCMSSRIEVKGF